MEALVYIANVLYLASYFMSDLLRLRLRLLTVTAACVLVAYFSLQPEPMITVICWDLFYVALNMFQIFRIVRCQNQAAR